jgi:Ferritin-like domain
LSANVDRLRKKPLAVRALTVHGFHSSITPGSPSPTAAPASSRSQGEKTMNSKRGTNHGSRRNFLQNSLAAAGAATVGIGTLASGKSAFAEERSGHLDRGDAAILRFLAAAEILETDLWQQYNELAGIQDSQVPGGSGNSAYTAAVAVLDEDMAQYIHDNTQDELTHEQFINAYLASKGADTVNLDHFRNLPSSQATGAQQIGRLTNLMELAVDTTWYTRYRSANKNPDFGDTLPQAIPSIATGKHPAIPRWDADTTDANHLQAIANTAGFHFATIEQGGTSLYAQLAQRVTGVEVLRIVLSIGGTEIMHFQTWSDKAGNAPPLTDGDVVFPDLNAPPLGGEEFQTNLIMPEPTIFLNKHFPVVSIIRPTETRGAATGALKFLTSSNLFLGQSRAFFAHLTELAEEADEARRGF